MNARLYPECADFRWWGAVYGQLGSRVRVLGTDGGSRVRVQDIDHSARARRWVPATSLPLYRSPTPAGSMAPAVAVAEPVVAAGEAHPAGQVALFPSRGESAKK